jgi:hypothetical protein
LQEELLPDVRALFRDLNGLLRTSPILIVWPVTERDDLEKMQQYASSFSSTLFHKRIPVMEFTGPPVLEYPKIAKNTISFFNHGRTYHDFQLHDSDFELAKEKYENKPLTNQIIRDYLKEIKLHWEDKTNYIEKLQTPYRNLLKFGLLFVIPKLKKSFLDLLNRPLMSLMKLGMQITVSYLSILRTIKWKLIGHLKGFR